MSSFTRENFFYRKSYSCLRRKCEFGGMTLNILFYKIFSHRQQHKLMSFAVQATQNKRRFREAIQCAHGMMGKWNAHGVLAILTWDECVCVNPFGNEANNLSFLWWFRVHCHSAICFWDVIPQHIFDDSFLHGWVMGTIRVSTWTGGCVRLICCCNKRRWTSRFWHWPY